MPKYKTPRPKQSVPQPRAGWPCVVIVIFGVLALSLLLFLVMKYAS